MPKDMEITLDTDKHTVVSTSEYRGVPRIDVRHYWNENPSKKGINLPLEDAMILVNGILQVVNECTDDNFVIVSADELETC
jgi:hypothetical protein